MKRANVARRNKHKKHHKRRYGKNHNYGGGNNNINTKKRSNNFIKSSKPPLSSRSNAGDKKQLAGKFKNGNNLGQSTIDLNEIQSEGNELQIIANSDGPGFISTWNDQKDIQFTSIIMSLRLIKSGPKINTNPFSPALKYNSKLSLIKINITWLMKNNTQFYNSKKV